MAILSSMAIPKIKATYSLDPATIQLLERVSRRWGVSKSEALRRAIQASAALPAPADGRLDVLDRLQKATALSPTNAEKWARDAHAERRASDPRRT